MSESNTELIKTATANELLQARNKIIKLCQTVRVNQKLIGRTADNFIGDHHYLGGLLSPSDRDDKETIRKKVDAAFWRFVVESAFLTNIMTESAKAEFFKRIDKDPPLFTEQELINFTEKAEQYYVNNGIATIKEVYKKLIDCFYSGNRLTKRDNCRKIEKSFRICGGIVYSSWGSFSDNYYGRGSIFEDVLTACYLLDLGSRPSYAERFQALAREAFKDKGDTVETPYFAVRAFKNGNQLVTWNANKLKVLADFNKYGAGDSHELPQPMRKKYKPEHFQQTTIF